MLQFQCRVVLLKSLYSAGVTFTELACRYQTKKHLPHSYAQLFREDWVVYAKRPFGGPQHVLQYLARYTHRVAISNHRIVDVDDTHVVFRWKDYAHHGKRRTMRLAHEEFLRRFLQHVLPKGFPRIRYFGFLANRRRAEFLPRCRALLAPVSLLPPMDSASDPDLWRCPACQGPMRVIERVTPAQIRNLERRRIYAIDSS